MDVRPLAFPGMIEILASSSLRAVPLGNFWNSGLALFASPWFVRVIDEGSPPALRHCEAPDAIGFRRWQPHQGAGCS